MRRTLKAHPSRLATAFTLSASFRGMKLFSCAHTSGQLGMRILALDVPGCIHEYRNSLTR